MPNDDTLRDHQSKAGRSRSRKKLAALAKSQPAAAAARRGKPATIGVKRLRELVRIWRERADAASDSYAAPIEQCAEDLERVLDIKDLIAPQ